MGNKKVNKALEHIKEFTQLDLIRDDLKHQLDIPDEIDWTYFVETAKRALAEAKRLGVNMDPDETVILNEDTTVVLEFGKHYEDITYTGSRSLCQHNITEQSKQISDYEDSVVLNQIIKRNKIL